MNASLLFACINLAYILAFKKPRIGIPEKINQ